MKSVFFYTSQVKRLVEKSLTDWDEGESLNFLPALRVVQIKITLVFFFYPGYIAVELIKIQHVPFMIWFAVIFRKIQEI